MTKSLEKRIQNVAKRIEKAEKLVKSGDKVVVGSKKKVKTTPKVKVGDKKGPKVTKKGVLTTKPRKEPKAVKKDSFHILFNFPTSSTVDGMLSVEGMGEYVRNLVERYDPKLKLITPVDFRTVKSVLFSLYEQENFTLAKLDVEFKRGKGANATFYGISKRNPAKDEYNFERGVKIAIVRALRGECVEV